MITALLRFTIFTTYLISASSQLQAETQRSLNISEYLMEATFKITDDESLGTVFIFGKPITVQGKSGQILILVTAEHVLKNMPGDSVNIVMRHRSKEGQWERHLIPVKIRSQGKPKWQRFKGGAILCTIGLLQFCQ